MAEPQAVGGFKYRSTFGFGFSFMALCTGVYSLNPKFLIGFLLSFGIYSWRRWFQRKQAYDSHKMKLEEERLLEREKSTRKPQEV